MKTAEQFLKEYMGKQQIMAWGDVHEVMKRFAMLKCKEQQELAKKHLFDVGQTKYLTSKEDMPYPKM
jgi:hypothetical protein